VVKVVLRRDNCMPGLHIHLTVLIGRDERTFCEKFLTTVYELVA